MQGPGENLRQEREARGKTIEEMAEATGIRPHLLTALEQEAFESLPGRGFGKLYIRAYAEVLGFDPRPVIEAYDRAVRGRQAAASPPAPASEARPVKVAVARWRPKRKPERADADRSGEDEEEPIEELPPVDEAPREAGGAPEEAQAETETPPEEALSESGAGPEIIAGTVEAEPEPIALEQETAPEVMEGPGIQSVPLPAIEEAPALSSPLVEAVSPSRLVRSRRWLLASLLLPVLLPLMAWLVFSRPTADAPPMAARREPVPGEAIAPPPSPPPRREAAEAPRTPPPAQAPVREPTASSLEVTESGVGLRLVGARLEGESDRFRTGQRVTFAMRVLGGRAGESIRHVWLRDGKVEQSIRLRLGGSSWRTYSTKTLGRPGAWAVEARDEEERVLARVDLTVAPETR